MNKFPDTSYITAPELTWVAFVTHIPAINATKNWTKRNVSILKLLSYIKRTILYLQI